MKFPPASTNLSMMAQAVSWSQRLWWPPLEVKVIVPRHNLLTLRPVLPKNEYSMVK